MKKEYEDYLYSGLNKDELVKMSKSDFSILANGVRRLRCIIVNRNCDNDILALLIQNQSTPFDKLEDRILDGLARFEITTISLLFLAVKRFKNNNNFMRAVKYNVNYPQFIVKQKEAADNFNKTVDLSIKQLAAASNLATIENIKTKETELEQHRAELIEQYPDIAGQLSNMSEFTNAVIAATLRVSNSHSNSSERFTPMFNRDATNNQRNQDYAAATSQSADSLNQTNCEFLMNVFNSVYR